LKDNKEILKEELQAAEDSGFGQKFVGGERLIKDDGTYNILRKNKIRLSLYEYLISIKWRMFLVLTFFGFLVINLVFALLFYINGPEHLKIPIISPAQDYVNCLYFSVQTFTSVGYGFFNPQNNTSNILASLNAFTGLLSFALATGLLFARFSKPRVNIIFSDNFLLTPFQDTYSIQLRLVNANDNNLLQMQSSANYTWTEKDSTGMPRRKFHRLKLELDFIYLFPLNWTLVHKIDETSPFYQKTKQELIDMQGELLVFVRGFDDTYGDYIFKNKSYLMDEMEVDKVFLPMYISKEGKNVLDINTINDVRDL
jgi:inward rectifier potassium channel